MNNNIFIKFKTNNDETISFSALQAILIKSQINEKKYCIYNESNNFWKVSLSMFETIKQLICTFNDFITFETYDKKNEITLPLSDTLLIKNKHNYFISNVKKTTFGFNWKVTKKTFTNIQSKLCFKKNV